MSRASERAAKIALIAKLEKKSVAGDMIATTKLGEMYGEGLGVKKNYKRVLKLLRRGSKFRDPFSTWVLADSLAYGTYGKIDKKKALIEYKKAGKLGVVHAWTSIGLHHYNKNTAADKKIAIKYYRMAAREGDMRANCNLGIIHLTGKGGRKSPKLAEKYFLRSAKKGFVDALYNLGYLNAIIFGNRTESLKWLRRAVKAGDKDSQELLNEILENKLLPHK